MAKSGELFVVATPIGNLGDITIRAIEILKQVDIIAAEDTRHSSTLFKHYGIRTQSVSLHNYNETKRTQFILSQLESGKDVALITDAGTPLISDPGNHLVSKAREYGFKVIPIPGACAAITGLCASGLPTDKFIFEGFLSPKSKQRIDRLQELTNEFRTMIFYESPHRLLKTIKDMREIFGDERYVVLGKELTKTFETVHGDTILGLQNWLLEKPERQKGEFVIMVKGSCDEVIINPEVLRIFELLFKELSHKQAAALTANITGANKNELYKISIKNIKK